MGFFRDNSSEVWTLTTSPLTKIWKNDLRWKFVLSNEMTSWPIVLAAVLLGTERLSFSKSNTEAFSPNTASMFLTFEWNPGRYWDILGWIKFLWLEIQRKNWIILTFGSYVILSQRSFFLLKIVVLFYDLDVHIFTIHLVNQDKSTFCIFLI